MGQYLLGRLFDKVRPFRVAFDEGAWVSKHSPNPLLMQALDQKVSAGIAHGL